MKFALAARWFEKNHKDDFSSLTSKLTVIVCLQTNFRRELSRLLLYYSRNIRRFLKDLRVIWHSGVSAERRHLKISGNICGGLPTRRYEEVESSVSP